jgi:hypothetical protein
MAKELPKEHKESLEIRELRERIQKTEEALDQIRVHIFSLEKQASRPKSQKKNSN